MLNLAYYEMEYFYIPTNVYHHYMVLMMYAIEHTPHNNGYRKMIIITSDAL